MSVRVRYAPSPTGLQHIGGIRTALFNYFFAKSSGGKFILRVEDTDRERYSDESLNDLYETLDWLGIKWDEGPVVGGPYGPYIQSERFDIYKKYAEQLVKEGKAYYCYCTPERLEKLREEQIKNKSEYQGYDRHCANLTEEERAELERQGIKPVIRLKVPTEGKTTFHDVIMGDITRKNKDISPDPILLKSDGFPTYHLANVIDDHLMGITHIMRAQEWIPSGPLHVLLYEAFGWEESRPAFAHLSLLLKPDGKGKLSKRDGDRLGFPVFPLKWVNQEGEVSRGYREDGYYPQAFINMLALLGWNPGTEQEIFSLDQLVEAFSLERVIKSGARFNPEKAKWFNQEYLRMQSDEELAKEFVPVLKENGADAGKYSMEYLKQLCSLIKERAHFVNDFWNISRYIFVPPVEFAEADVRKFCTSENLENISKVAAFIESMEVPQAPCSDKAGAVASIEEKLTGYIKENEWKMGAVMNTLRLFFVGEAKGLGIADIIYFLGKEESLRRIEYAAGKLQPTVR